MKDYYLRASRDLSDRKIEKGVVKQHLPLAPPRLAEPRSPQKIVFELRSETGGPLESALQIAHAALLFKNKPVHEYYLPNMYEDAAHFYTQRAPFQTPKYIDARKHGAVFFNGYLMFDAHTGFSFKDFSLVLTHRSAKPVAVQVFLLNGNKDIPFGRIKVEKPYHWEKTFLSCASSLATEKKAPSYEDIVINKVTCVNDEGTPLSTVSTNDPIFIEIEYSPINKTLFENLQLLITLRNKRSAKEYAVVTRPLHFNPLVATHVIVAPINITLPPGEYDVVLFLIQKLYGGMNALSILTLDQDGYHLIQNSLSIKVVEQLDVDVKKFLTNPEFDNFYYN